MGNKIKMGGLLHDLQRVISDRQKVADCLDAISQTLNKTESELASKSGQLGLQQEIEHLAIASDSLRKGVFRLLVLGDMKRGKSTFLNALLGENLLPSDVSPCTAVLTVVKYGLTQKVTIHYKDGQPPEQIDFQQFKQRYTIKPEETKSLEEGKKLAFPNISHAVVEHPLPLLGQGIEFIDSPGLNDTEALNELSLSYIYNCHAILFVLSASQPCTLEERRYLQNYLKNRGLNIFFLINGWDRVRHELVNPEDTQELQIAENKLRECFFSNLADCCQNSYHKRVFEVSALNALRRRIKDPEADLAGTGFPEFMSALNIFLTKERANAELEQAKAIAVGAFHRFQESIERRIPLMSNSVEELKQKIDSAQSDFEQLTKIGKDFQNDIREISDSKAQEIANSFKKYILNLESTFETDFTNSQPDLDFMQFLDRYNRSAFYNSFKQAFERYSNDRLLAWEFIAKQEMSAAFSQLDEKANNYRVEYTKVLEAMNKKLLGYRFYVVGHKYHPNQAPVWSDTVFEIFSSVPNFLNSGIYSFNLFWREVLFSACVIIVLQIVGLIFAGLTISVFATILGSAGILALQAEYVRRVFMDTTKKEFAKYLPEFAEEQWQIIYDGVKKCFDVYQKEISDRLCADVNSRKAELNNLLQQKRSQDIDIEAEAKRLRDQEAEISSYLQKMELIGDSLYR